MFSLQLLVITAVALSANIICSESSLLAKTVRLLKEQHLDGEINGKQK
jgi:hypothetical protein